MSKKARILRIVYDFADDNVCSSGLAPNPYELSLAQGKLGHKVYVLTGNLNGKNLIALRFMYKLAGGNVIVFNLPRALWKFGPFLTSSLFVLPYYFYFRLTKKIDLVHNHQQMGIWFLLYKKIFGWIDKIPVVHTNHGLVKSRERQMIARGAKIPFWARYFEYPLHKFSDWLSVRVANVIVAVSQDTKEEIMESYHPQNRVVVVENAVPFDRFSKNGKKLNLQIGKSSVVVGNIGVLSERKNIEILVKSLVYLPNNFHLLLVGKWQKSLKLKVSRFIQEKNLSKRISIFPQQSYWKIDTYYRAIDIFVLPSSHEGLPKAAIEALATGCKVLGAGFSMSQELPNMYYLPEINPKAIAKSVLDVHRKKSFYNKTRQIIENHYSWESKAKELDSIYKRLIKS